MRLFLVYTINVLLLLGCKQRSLQHVDQIAHDMNKVIAHIESINFDHDRNSINGLKTFNEYIYYNYHTRLNLNFNPSKPWQSDFEENPYKIELKKEGDIIYLVLESTSVNNDKSNQLKKMKEPLGKINNYKKIYDVWNSQYK